MLSSVRMSPVIRCNTSPLSFCSVIKRRMMLARASGFSTRKARSSSSSRIHCIPMRPASGAKISIVSRAFCCCLSTRMDLIVRMLCSRSDSFTRMTRKSFDIAINSLRKFSACLVSVEFSCRLVSFVTPSTSSATSVPKRSSTSPKEALVSSIVSCNRAVMIVASSNCCSVRIAATDTGWVK